MDPEKPWRTNSRCWGQRPKKAVMRRPLQLLYPFEVSCATNENCRPKSELAQSEQLAGGLVTVNRERRKEAVEGKRLRRHGLRNYRTNKVYYWHWTLNMVCCVLIFPFANLRTVCQVFISWFKQWAVNHSMVNRRSVRDDVIGVRSVSKQVNELSGGLYIVQIITDLRFLTRRFIQSWCWSLSEMLDRLSNTSTLYVCRT